MTYGEVKKFRRRDEADTDRVVETHAGVARKYHKLVGNGSVWVGGNRDSTATDDKLLVAGGPFGFSRLNYVGRKPPTTAAHVELRREMQAYQRRAAVGGSGEFRRLEKPELICGAYDRQRHGTVATYRAPQVEPLAPYAAEAFASKWIYTTCRSQGREVHESSFYMRNVELRVGTGLTIDGVRYWTRRTDLFKIGYTYAGEKDLARRVAFLEQLYTSADFTTLYVNAQELEEVQEGKRKAFRVVFNPYNHALELYVGWFVGIGTLLESQLI